MRDLLSNMCNACGPDLMTLSTSVIFLPCVVLLVHCQWAVGAVTPLRSRLTVTVVKSQQAAAGESVDRHSRNVNLSAFRDAATGRGRGRPVDHHTGSKYQVSTLKRQTCRKSARTQRTHYPDTRSPHTPVQLLFTARRATATAVRRGARQRGGADGLGRWVPHSPSLSRSVSVFSFVVLTAMLGPGRGERERERESGRAKESNSSRR